jgi:hypothetical protein
MTILSILTGNNITKHMYEAVRKEVDWEHNHPEGLILHAAGFDDSGNNFTSVFLLVIFGTLFYLYSLMRVYRNTGATCYKRTP